MTRDATRCDQPIIFESWLSAPAANVTTLNATQQNSRQLHRNVAPRGNSRIRQNSIVTPGLPPTHTTPQGRRPPPHGRGGGGDGWVGRSAPNRSSSFRLIDGSNQSWSALINRLTDGIAVSLVCDRFAQVFFFCAILYIFGIIQIILLVYCWGHIDGNPMWPKWESYVAEMGILCGRDGNPMWPKMGIWCGRNGDFCYFFCNISKSCLSMTGSVLGAPISIVVRFSRNPIFQCRLPFVSN